ncbi:sulfatase-like hydrolase/transferase [Tichowtungia aerotolerans]|uniref:Sulfatase-like hydrolase/transferase n=2 Tax=Tichowtungia aerotolerans TaxID=2697043 RepID=A0A6P1MFK8_9BACT|nr:sulfatase-like hydrolase/transferase [Tichowtungia aerotolerans]
MADDQGWGDVGYNDHPLLKTPNLDEMAKVSLRFDRFYAAAPVCSPTRASILTGRNPNRCGVVNHGHPMRPQDTTLAEALKPSGYTTGHFGKWHLGSLEKTSPVNPGNSGFDEWFSAPNFFDMNPLMCSNGVVVQCHGDSSDVVVDRAIDFIREQVDADQPFLALVWFAAPHDPHEASQEDLALYGDDPFKGYFAEITAMDRAFGRLRREICTLGIRDNTILWYTSDNGGLDERSTGGRGKKGLLLEGGLRVPALLEWPARISSPRITDAPCVSSDIYPTLLEITKTSVSNQYPMDGISLVPLIDDTMTARPKPIGFWRYPSPGRATWSDRLLAAMMAAQTEGKEIGNPDWQDTDAGSVEKQYPEDSAPGHATWLDWPWKLHRRQQAGKVPTFALYNLKNDPYEKNNLIHQMPERADSMRAKMENWQGSVLQSLNGRDY